MQCTEKQKEQIASAVGSIKTEGGFVLVLTMVILVVLTILGLSATRLSRVELIVSGNDRIHKETFTLPMEEVSLVICWPIKMQYVPGHPMVLTRTTMATA